jgi:hypothetical protein
MLCPVSVGHSIRIFNNENLVHFSNLRTCLSSLLLHTTLLLPFVFRMDQESLKSSGQWFDLLKICVAD